MAFDFLGTFTKKMWTTFDAFTSATLYNKFISIFPQELEISETEISAISPYTPTISDHMRAEKARMGIYKNRFQDTYNREKLSSATYKRDQHSIQYFSKEGTAFPPSSAGGKPAEVLEDFYAVLTNDDYRMADAIMLIKSRIAKFIKSYYERHEYRIKKCDFYMHEVDRMIVDAESLALDETYLYQLEKIRSQVDQSPSVIHSLITETTDYDLDGEATSTTQQVVASAGDQATSVFMIPSTAQRIIYRGVLYHRREQLGLPSTLDDYFQIYKTQNPAADLE